MGTLTQKPTETFQELCQIMGYSNWIGLIFLLPGSVTFLCLDFLIFKMGMRLEAVSELSRLNATVCQMGGGWVFWLERVFWLLWWR